MSAEAVPDQSPDPGDTVQPNNAEATPEAVNNGGDLPEERPCRIGQKVKIQTTASGLAREEEVSNRDTEDAPALTLQGRKRYHGIACVQWLGVSRYLEGITVSFKPTRENCAV